MAQFNICKSGTSNGIENSMTFYVDNQGYSSLYWDGEYNNNTNIIIQLNLNLQELGAQLAHQITYIGFELYKYDVQTVMTPSGAIHQATFLCGGCTPYTVSTPLTDNKYNIKAVITDSDTITRIKSLTSYNDYKYVVILKYWIEDNSDAFYCDNVVMMYNSQFQMAWSLLQHIPYQNWLRLTGQAGAGEIK